MAKVMEQTETSITKNL